jgi:CubicO group peptidase (beta-lactamase class C family)
MTARGFTQAGLEALDASMARHVSRGEVPGVVSLIARGEAVHVTVAGGLALEGGPAPMRRDSIFRIASLTKPIVGVAAMLLIQDGAMALDDPVEHWLPELANRRVLRALDAELDDTIAAERAITVEDALSFRLGFGCIMAPGNYPVAAAEASLGLKTLGPPWPPTTLTQDEWIAALGSLPLLDQPGERWRYNTGATVAGILVSRVAGAPLAEVLASRVFAPLGMPDTGFLVPAAKRDRFTSMYEAVAELPERPAKPHDSATASYGPGGSHGASGEGLSLIDSPDGWYATPPALPDASSWLVSTVDDLWAFTSMLDRARLGAPGELLSPESVAEMLRDRTTVRDKAENPWFFGAGGASGWGLMMSVPTAGASEGPAVSHDGAPRGYGWDGGSGTMWRTDPATGLTGILLTQRMTTSPEPPRVALDFWAAAFGALA